MALRTMQIQRYLFQVRDKPQIYVTNLGSLEADAYLLGEDERQLPVVVTLGRVYKPRFSRFQGKEGSMEMDLLPDQAVMETIPLSEPYTVLEFLKLNPNRVKIPIGKRIPESIFFDGIVPVKKDDTIVLHMSTGSERAQSTNEVARIEVLPTIHFQNLPEVLNHPTRVYNFRGHYLDFDKYLDNLSRV